MDWLRWHHGTSKDPKWRVISRRAGVSIVTTVSVWTTIVENASESSDRGVLQGWDPEDVAAQFDIEPEQVRTVFEAMQGKVLSGNRLTGWEKRNPKREREDDDSTERVRQYRERLRKHGGTTGGYLKHQPALMERDKSQCIYCGITEGLCIDHMVPVIQGGTDDPDNLAMACKACNSGKSGRTPEQASYEIIHLPAKEAYQRFMSRHVTPTTSKSRPDKIDKKERLEREKERTETLRVCFEELWEQYPSKDGRREAEKHFRASVRTDSNIAEIHQALNHYTAHLKTNSWKKPKNGGTWFNNWRDWVNWKEPQQNAQKKTALTYEPDEQKAWAERVEREAAEDLKRTKSDGKI